MMREHQIGFSQRIQLKWLEYTANLVLAGNSRDEIITALDERLRESLSVDSDPKRGSRDKTITILTKVWVTVPQELQMLRDEGLELLNSSDTSERMMVHWCMCMVAYPFFGTVAEVVGRLLRLQGSVGAAQVQRRLRERFGERETVTRAVRRILRMFIDWGALQESGVKGLYRSATKRPVDGPSSVLWAVEAVLRTKSHQLRSVTNLLQGPHLFPFDISLPSMRELETRDTLEITHHGLDHEILICLAVQLRNSPAYRKIYFGKDI